jgi:hypothetical protein
MKEGPKKMKYTPTYDRWDLDWQQLTIRVVEDSGITVYLGIDANNKVYVLNVIEE